MSQADSMSLRARINNYSKRAGISPQLALQGFFIERFLARIEKSAYAENLALLDAPKKVAFLSSRKIAPDDVLRCYDWAAKVRDSDACIMSGFQSPLEKDVLRFLLRGKAPIILVLARRLWRKIPEELRDPINEGRLLIVSPVSASRASALTAAVRNRWILENCSTVYLGALDPSGEVARQMSKFRNRGRKKL